MRWRIKLNFSRRKKNEKKSKKRRERLGGADDLRLCCCGGIWFRWCCLSGRILRLLEIWLGVRNRLNCCCRRRCLLQISSWLRGRRQDPGALIRDNSGKTKWPKWGLCAVKIKILHSWINRRYLDYGSLPPVALLWRCPKKDFVSLLLDYGTSRLRDKGEYDWRGCKSKGEMESDFRGNRAWEVCVKIKV